MKPVRLRFLPFAAVWLLSVSHGGAATLNLLPSAVTVNTGDTVLLNAIISGLGAGVAPTVGAFDLTVNFNSSVLSPAGVAFGPFLGNPGLFEALTDVTFPTANTVEFAEISLLSSTALDALQPSSFMLATLSFKASRSGTSAFNLTAGVVDDTAGNKLFATPEPSAFILLGLGVLALMSFAKFRSQRMRPTP